MIYIFRTEWNGNGILEAVTSSIPLAEQTHLKPLLQDILTGARFIVIPNHLPIVKLLSASPETDMTSE